MVEHRAPNVGFYHYMGKEYDVGESVLPRHDGYCVQDPSTGDLVFHHSHDTW